MRVCIHRGARQVGGSCVEVEHDGARLVIDVGRPLDVGLDVEAPLPPVAGLAAGNPSLLGVLISHGHPDHYGLAAQVHARVPLFMGEATNRILREAAFFAPTGQELEAAGFLRDREPFDIGPFQVTPYLVDHSAFDAYALLVEAGDRRLLYSGDLRAHGRKAALFERLLREPPADVDVLLLEGTHIRTDGEPVATLSEREVEERCVELFGVAEGMVLACYSAQNIDRLVTLYRAAKRSGRVFVLDLYGASIAGATGRPDTIPQASWEGVRVFVPLTQRIRVKRAEAFERTAQVRGARLYPEDLAEQAGRLVLSFRGSMAAELERARCLEGALALWSMWAGYLEEPSGQRLREWLDRHHIPLELLHSSGHATVNDLQRLAAAVRPRQVVPVHTNAPERFPELFERARLREDGEWWIV